MFCLFVHCKVDYKDPSALNGLSAQLIHDEEERGWMVWVETWSKRRRKRDEKKTNVI